jgi:glycosyltransferase involved in cell wall biosynthesis
VADALRMVIGGPGQRVVRFPAFDVHDDLALRVVQVVTSIQQGGAERIALSLARGLGKAGVRSLLITLGRPTRTAFPVPPGTLDLSQTRGGRQRRLEAVAGAVRAFDADLVLGHLLAGEDMARLSALGVPLVATIHNVRLGWPSGLEALRADDAMLVIACSRAVEADLRAAGVPIAVRTVWNGIDFAPFERTPALLASGRAFRERLGLGSDDFVLLALANPRPQKRLDLLPAILAATRAELVRRASNRPAKLVIVGETSQINEAAVQAEAAVRAEVARLGLKAHVHFPGAVTDVAPVLVAADALVSCSAYEGLSLAHLEALAAGLPVVTTDAGGTAEIARDNPAMSVLPLDAGPDAFADVLAGVALSPHPEGRAKAAVHFGNWHMIEGYARLYPRALEAARGRRRGEGLWLVTNNFSTGGAQSSARRLLLGLAAEGVPVRAAVLEEEAAHPTPGRRALTSAGIPVLVLPPSGTMDPAQAVTMLLERLDEDPPEAVLLWNVITEYKLLLADGLLDIPLYDVSPGEMYFTSLERYFQRPRPGLPYRTAVDYGARLAGAIVKYHAEADLAARTLGCAVHVIPNGVPLDAVPLSQRPPNARLRIGTLARISPQKRLEELLEALRRASGRLPPHVVQIAGGVERGSAEYAVELRRLTEELSMEWVGELEDVRPFLSELDLFVMISEPGGCPNASLEAMAARLAVIATDVGGAAEQVQDGITGRLVRRGDTEALAEALIELAMDPERRARLGTAGRARAEACFDQKRMVADYRRVCLATPDAKGRGPTEKEPTGSLQGLSQDVML